MILSDVLNRPVAAVWKRSPVKRSTLAVLVSPGIAATIFSVGDVILRPDGYGTLTPVYFFYAILLGLPAAAAAMFILRKYELMQLWHFAAAGLVAGLLCGITQARAWPEATIAIILIGPVVGAAAWFISEWGTNSRRTE